MRKLSGPGLLPRSKGTTNATNITDPMTTHNPVFIHAGQPRSAAFHKSRCLKLRAGCIAADVKEKAAQEADGRQHHHGIRKESHYGVLTEVDVHFPVLNFD